MFVAKALEYTLRRVVLLTVNRSVLLQNTVDDIREGASFGRFGGWRRRYPGGSECRSIFLTVSRAMPNRLAASRWLRPSTWQASRTRRYRSTVYILPPSISKKIEGYRWQSFTPPAAGKSRRFRGLICHRRSQARLSAATEHPARHSKQDQSKADPRLRQKAIQGPQWHRTHVRAPQGLSAHRHAIRQKRRQLHGRPMPRGTHLLLDLNESGP